MPTYDKAFKKSVAYFNGDELAANVFLTKYALTAPNGEILEETPDAMHKRLAKEFARIEQNYPNPLSEDEIYNLFKDFKYIIPQGSPMAGIGNPYQNMSISNCFVAGTQVHTLSGVKNIEDIEIGDYVITHNNNVKPVIQKHKNRLNNRALFDLKLFRTPQITVTGNHNFWSITQEQLEWGESPQWNSVESLRCGDFIAIPNFFGDSKVEFLDLSISDMPLSFYETNDSVWYEVNKTDETIMTNSTWESVSSLGNTKTLRKSHQILNRFIRLDNDFAFFLGLWYGDGCIFSTDKIQNRLRGITFTFNAKEQDLIDFVSSYGEKTFGIKPDINFNTYVDGTTQVVFHSTTLAYAFMRNFGRGFNGKKLMPQINSWDIDRIESLLAGLISADGTVTEEGDCRVVLSNKSLVKEIYHLSRRAGMVFGYSENDTTARLDLPKRSSLLHQVKKTYSDNRIDRALSKSESVFRTIEIDGTKFVKIDKKQKSNKTPEFVYTFGVEDDHSYSVEGVLCQNCFVIDSPYDSYGGLLKTDQEEAQIMKRRGGVGFDISTIRPKGVQTANAAKTTDGIAVFMERFSNTCREVAQGGRRGALMLSISVHHPEIETFINIKRDLTKVTGANISVRLTDEFMKAVENDKDYEVRFPVDSDKPTITNRLNARGIWDQIIESAHSSAEPGLLFWDTVQRRTPAEAYPEFRSVSTNPCLSGATLIATADGRNAVSIKQLAEEGKDVPVYSVDARSGIISIKMGRNPRITGYDKELVRITLDDGTFYDVTPNHGMMLRDGTKVEAKDLKPGDSLSRFTKRAEPVSKDGQLYYRVNTDSRSVSVGRIFEHRLISQFHNPNGWEHKKVAAKEIGFAKTGGIVVHHKDFNGLNNRPDNLEVLTFREHQTLHAELADVSGENNPRFTGHTEEEIRNHAILLTKQLNRRFGYKDWQGYAKENGLPQTFSDYRTSFLGTVSNLAQWAAIECDVEYIDVDPRLIKSLQSMRELGYTSRIDGNVVLVQKICENCQNYFETEHIKREIAYCSHRCSLDKINSNVEFQKMRTIATASTYAERSIKVRENQARIYSNLKFQLNRKPLIKEWEAACRAEGISYRLKSKNAYQNFKELAEAGDNYNHKVVSVEPLDGLHTVYNITVDDNHTTSIVSWDNTTLSGVNTFQCGEIVLSPYDSCRLLLVNVYSFVENPFTPEAKFNFPKFRNTCILAQRLMDDMVDLEIECIDKILAKIQADPEPEDVKANEINLWNKIRNACVTGRRTGTGVTAVGDAVAALNLYYGSDDSVDMTERIYRELAVGCYESTIEMAKERGPFPAYDYELEKDHEFINQIVDYIPGLSDEWKKYGRRNIALTTTAPAGSVSVLTQTTSGIEPAYLLEYKRRKRINPNDKDVTPDFIDELGDKWVEFPVYHHGFKKWMDVTGKTDVKESPYYGATSNDINWVQKVKAQAAAQKWICHAISNTTNLPSDVSIETVKDIYMTGWKSGCKGVTIYRDGSRSGVLVSNETKSPEAEITIHHAPKRPIELPCEVHNMTVLGEKWTFFVGLLNGRPYEIMGGLSKHVSMPKRVKHGKTVKHNGPTSPKARYDFHYDYEDDPDNEVILRDIATLFDNAIYSAFTRTISLALRHGTDVRFVVEQIQKGAEKEDDLFSFSKAVSRVLKGYIEEGTKVVGKKCAECGSDDLKYTEGCLSCNSCGWSKCM